MRLPASSKAYDAEQTLPFPPGGRNMAEYQRRHHLSSVGSAANKIPYQRQHKSTGCLQSESTPTLNSRSVRS